MNHFISIEVVRAEVKLLELAHEMVMLSTADDVVEVEGNTINLTYVGRGTESIALCLDGNYSDEMRVKTWHDSRRLNLILFRGLLRRKL